MILCPVCRYKDRSCKLRFLAEEPIFSCKSCFEREEKRRRAQPRPQPATVERDPLQQMGYREHETLTRET